MNGNNIIAISSEGRDISGLLHASTNDPWRKVLRVLIALKLLLVPLVFDPWLSATFDTPKAVLSHSLAWIMAAIIVMVLLKNPWKYQRKWIHVLVFCFIISAAFSTFFAADRYIALFGYPYRLLGFTTILDMGVLYAAMVIAIRKPRDCRLVIGGILISAVISSLYAGIQVLKWDPFTWGPQLGVRIFSTFGNPDFYGQYLSVLAVSLIAILVFQSLTWRWRAFFILTLGIILYLVGLVGTRSALIGIGAGVFCIALLWFRKTKLQPKKGWCIVLLLLIGVTITGMIFSRTLLSEKLNWYWIHRGFVQRGVIYETALREFADHPLFGVGPDNIGVLYFLYRPVRELGLRGPFYHDNSAHSWPLQILSTQGLVGFFIFIAILFSMAKTAWHLTTTPYAAFGSVVAAALAAYFGTGLLTPGSQGTEWIGWTGIGLLAALHEMSGREKRSEARPVLSSAAIRWLLAPVFLVTLMSLFFTVRPYIAARFAALPIFLLAGPQPNDRERFLALQAGIKATELDPGRAEWWKIRGAAEEHAGNLRAALISYEEAARRAPHYPEHWWNLSRINARFVEEGDPMRKEAALNAMGQAIASDPKGPESHASSARLLLLMGENKRALESARRGIELFANKPDYYILAATAAHRLGESKEAESILQKGISIFSEGASQFTYPLRLALAQLYLELKEIQKGQEQISSVLERDPNNADALAIRDKLNNLKK